MSRRYRSTRTRYRSSGSELTPSQIAGAFIGFILAAVMAYFLFNGGVFSKIKVVVTHNMSFWFTSACGVLYAFYHKWRHPKEFSWVELPVQIVVTVFSLFMFYAFFFYSATDLKDREIWNSYVTKAEYYEEWTEEVCTMVCDGYDADGNCTGYSEKCHDVYHPPEWRIILSTSEVVEISKANYKSYIKRFGGEKKQNLSRSGQVSIGDGDMFYVACSSGEGQVSSSTEHGFVNYLKGSSETIRRRSGESHVAGFEKLLSNYPGVKGGAFGKIEFDRVIVKGVNPPKDWVARVDKMLDDKMAHLGPVKQANALVYIVGTSDQSFTHALESHWVNGKKNDIIVIIGMSNWPNISWASVLAWTDEEDFKIALRNKILDLDTLDGREAELVDVITNQIGQPGGRDGFVRKPMADLVYLAGDVSLPWWANILVVLISGSLAWLTSWALSNNEIRDSE